MMICPICKKEVVSLHRRSHLLPEWFYRDYYDANHKMISLDFNSIHKSKVQKGFYKSIICKACEIQSSRYDHYASLIMTDRSTETKEHQSITRKKFNEISEGERCEFSYWRGIDFLKFQKFIFGIILRAHIAKSKEGKQLLINKHFEKIRTLYNSQADYDDNTYPIVVVGITNEDQYRDIAFLPYVKSRDGHHIIEFSGVGYLVNVYVSSHRKPKFVDSIKLKSDGSMRIIHMGMRETGIFKSMLPSVAKIIKQENNSR